MENFDFWLNCSLGRVENLVFSEHSCHFFSCQLTSLAHCARCFSTRFNHLQVPGTGCRGTAFNLDFTAQASLPAKEDLTINFYVVTRKWRVTRIFSWINATGSNFRFGHITSRKVFSIIQREGPCIRADLGWKITNIIKDAQSPLAALFATHLLEGAEDL